VLPFDSQALAHHRHLVARMSEGETKALQELHAIHVGRMHTVAMRILANREEAREAVQDAFVKAWRRAASYRSERGEVSSWLILIVRTTAIDRLRERRRRAEVLTHFAAECAPAELTPAPDPASEREFLDHHLAGLTPAQRQALELAFFAGCSQAEIAERMAAPISTIKNHLHRGLLRLRQLKDAHD
jgi:RNA polymerase sigma-70 factor (ECF subfamily)